MLLHDLVLTSARNYGDHPAVARADTGLSYTQLVDSINAAALGFVSAGVAPGDRIAIYLNKRIEAVVSYFAASLCGAVFVPVNPVLKASQVGHIVNDCGATVLVTTKVQVQTLSSTLESCGTVRKIVLLDADDLPESKHTSISFDSWDSLCSAGSSCSPSVKRIDNDVVSILYTSGSTGKPKGVVLSHRNMVAGALSVSSYLENSPGDIILAALPFAFDAGFSQMTTAFASGASIVLLDYLLPRDVTKAIAKYSVTGLTGVPPLWNQLASIQWPTEAVDSLRYLANTGGAMPTATLNALRKQLPKTSVYLMYGLTESFRSTYLPPDEVDKRPTSIGKAIPNAEVLVVDQDGKLCAAGEPGELVHRGALVSLGYWNDPEKTAERFRPLPGQNENLPISELAVWSGDTVIRDEEGYLYFVGRKDGMIKSSGYRISPTDIEEVIFATGLVKECAAIGVPHETLGQAVVIVAESSDPTNDTKDQVLQACKNTLPNYMLPAEVIWVGSLPRNPNGKIDRNLLYAEYKMFFEEATK